MSWRTEGEDIVFEGWEQGLAPSYHTGIVQARIVNVVDSPKEAFVGYDLQYQYSQPVTNSATTSSTTDLVTYTRNASPTIFGGERNAIVTGTPFVFTGTIPTSAGSVIVANRIFYAIFDSLLSTTGTFKVATTLANALAGTAIDITSNTSTTVVPVGPVFSGFGGISGQIAPYPATLVDTSGASFQYFGDSTGVENGSSFYGTGNLWYYIGVANNRTGWTIMDAGDALVVASIDTATDKITMPAGSTFATGTAVTISATTTMPAPLVAGTVYYTINSSATEFKLATTLANALAGTAIDITTAGSGTIRVDYAEGIYGLAAWQGYVFVFRKYQIDIMKISTGVWTLGWKTDLTGSLSHRAIVSGNNNTIYFCNGGTLGSILLKDPATPTPFDPTSTATYGYNTAALVITGTSGENSISLSELAQNLLIGGVFNKIYSWDRNSLNATPIFIAESYIAELVTINTTTYIFAGYRGRIYQTNGTSAAMFKKLPDYTSGVIQPIFVTKCAALHRNQLLFSVEVFNNAGTITDALTSQSGIWAIDFTQSQETTYTFPPYALRQLAVFSFGLDSDFFYNLAPFIMPLGTATSGLTFVTGWTVQINSVTYSGFDGYIQQHQGDTNPKPDSIGASQLITELVRVGGKYTKKTFTQVEWLLSTALGDDETVKIEVRDANDADNLESSWTTVGITGPSVATTNTISALYPVNFSSYQWVQFRITLFSTGFLNNPSYVRFKELRLR